VRIVIDTKTNMKKQISQINVILKHLLKYIHTKLTLGERYLLDVIWN